MDMMFLGQERDLGANLNDIWRVLLPCSVAQIFPILRLRVSFRTLLEISTWVVDAGNSFEILK